MTVEQPCSIVDCPNAAAFRTRSKPAWCLEHLTSLLGDAGLDPAEPFPGRPSDFWLSTCRACDTTAHYRLEYAMEKTKTGQPTCGLCRWRAWSAWGASLGATVDHADVAVDYSAFAESHGYELLDVLDPVAAGGIVRVRCRSCQRIQAERLSDISWGCSCQTKAATPNQVTRSKANRMTFAASNSPAIPWWDHEANDELLWKTAKRASTKVAAWKCPDCGHRFAERIAAMAEHPVCPACRDRERTASHAEAERLATLPVSEVPELLATWADETEPWKVMVGDHFPARVFRCAAGHRATMSPSAYLTNGCPSCRGQETAARQKPSVAEATPEIAEQWHPTLNGKYTPENVAADSKRQIFWHSGCCDHTWRDSPLGRYKYQRLRCPVCRSILGSLAWRDPGLAAEWAPENPTDPWHLAPMSTTQFLPGWVCATNPEHRWQAPLASRSNGAGCPECKPAGKSKVELDHLAAAKGLFGAAKSGRTLRYPEFTSRAVWAADISVEVEGSPVVIEYDGSYWHSADAKRLVDERKTLDLLAAGFHVVRLREHPLELLDVEHPKLLQLRVYSQAPDPAGVMREIESWASAGFERPQPPRTGVVEV
ncbi:zinc-ribbon domain-containing protein [Gryllotalpicola protaetiae]|uniref:zinc-ribbon domain-containing protein n=1 Tax=Gryllotalpicola protaetiae TaxID=2419771 RepID=UPI0013C4CF7A|nr:zinc-ribbon domain-containing protein [Gryllotalpicola protaetiae]